MESCVPSAAVPAAVGVALHHTPSLGFDALVGKVQRGPILLRNIPLRFRSSDAGEAWEEDGALCDLSEP
jgi:hypothetical protein